jgi:uncharacterized membrane protein YciS (DUF1049 family)
MKAKFSILSKLGILVMTAWALVRIDTSNLPMLYLVAYGTYQYFTIVALLTSIMILVMWSCAISLMKFQEASARRRKSMSRLSQTCKEANYILAERR